MTSAVTSTRELMNAIAAEMATGVDCAVESWLAQIEEAVTDPHLTTLGRMNAVRGILETYKHMSGKSQLFCRRVPAEPSAVRECL
jgi:hypothetical protein